jgi:hypothetical protein
VNSTVTVQTAANFSAELAGERAILGKQEIVSATVQAALLSDALFDDR